MQTFWVQMLGQFNIVLYRKKKLKISHFTLFASKIHTYFGALF